MCFGGGGVANLKLCQRYFWLHQNMWQSAFDSSELFKVELVWGGVCWVYKLHRIYCCWYFDKMCFLYCSRNKLSSQFKIPLLKTIVLWTTLRDRNAIILLSQWKSLIHQISLFLLLKADGDCFAFRRELADMLSSNGRKEWNGKISRSEKREAFNIKPNDIVIDTRSYHFQNLKVLKVI